MSTWHPHGRGSIVRPRFDVGFATARRLIAAAGLVVVQHAAAAPIPDELLQAVRAGEPVGVIVEFDASAIDRDAARRRARLPRRVDDGAALAWRSQRYRELKDGVARSLRHPDVEDALDYSHLPMSFKRIRSEAGLRALAAQPGVAVLHANRIHRPVLAESLPLIGQPVVASADVNGNGSTVAVIDNGIDIAQPAFGGCTAVGTPAGCLVTAQESFVAAPNTAGTDHAHGTNVAAIVVGVAPQARLASLNVFASDGNGYTSDIINAINWAVSHRVELNIVAINMSLGDGSRNTRQCQRSFSNAFVTPISNARNAGISVVVAAGNNAYSNGVYADGLSSPACVPGVVSVGAVYDSAMGGLAWGGSSASACTDYSITADRVACFSNSASYLTLLAPGALITAGGHTMGGTSQATPHVAGAIAALRAAFPDETPSAIEARLTANGAVVADSRPAGGRSLPRLNLRAAARPAHDDLVNAVALSAANGSTQADNRLATREPGEPQPVALGQQSVWWRWTAAASGPVTVSTAGSNFDTELDVYTGSSVSTLTRVAGNDNASSQEATSQLRFWAIAGTTYLWAVDSADGVGGDITLSWITELADMSAALTGPATARPGDTVNYTLRLGNAGPNTATQVMASVALPAGVSVPGVPVGCVAEASTITCNAGEVTAGAFASHLLSLHVDSLGAPVSLSATVSADQPDPVPSNNAASATLSLSAVVNPVDPGASSGSSGSVADIPTLPEWGLILLAGLLLAIGLKPQRAGVSRRPHTPD